MAFEIVGREEELASLRGLRRPGRGMGRPRSCSRARPGSGSRRSGSRASSMRARAGLRVLSSRPAEAERGLAHVGLGDLFEDVLDDVLPALSPPRRRALEVALLARGGAATIRSITARSPWRCATCCSCSASERRFCSRSTTCSGSTRPRRARSRSRCEGSRRAACSCCSPGGSPTPSAPSELEQALGAERVERLPVGPLSVGALHRLLRDRLGRPFARQTLLRIHERSGGNPFFALELARALDADVDPLEPLPVPGDARRARPREARRASRGDARGARARLGARARRRSRSSSGRASRPTRSTPAVAAHVIERENGTIRFTHPLLSSVLYHDLGDERRSVHGRIARIVDDPLLRARHLALSRDAPDADVAGVLDDAARLAAERGASAVAAELAEQALRLTPPDERDERHRRALAAARAHQRRRASGRAPGRSRPTCWPRRRSARCAPRLSSSSPSSRASTVPSRCSRRPCARRRRARRCSRSSTAGSRGRRASGRASCGRSSTRARRSSSPTSSTTTRSGSSALAVLAVLGCARRRRRGAGARRAGARARDRRRRRAAAAGGDARDRQHAARRASSETTRPVRLLEREYEEWRERDELRSARALWGLAWVELWGGPLGARGRARRPRRTTSASSTGSRCRRTTCRSPSIAVHRGQLELAREHSERALRARRGADRAAPARCIWRSLGLVALWSGDAHDGR